MKEIIRKYNFDNVVKKILKIFLSVFWLFPIKRNRVLFISYGGEQYSCNPKYLSEYLIKDDSITVDIVWAFKDLKKFKWLGKKNIQIVKYGSFRYMKSILTSKVIITNNSISSYLPIRKNQVVINTWHGGGAYKKVVSDDNIKERKVVKETAKLFNVFLSTCRKNTELMIRGTFGHEGKVIEVGFPRNDIFFNETVELKNKVYNHFDLKNNLKIAIYAPTFRKEADKNTYDLDVIRLKSSLEKRFGGEWMIMVRAHHAIKTYFDFNSYSNIVIDATEYDDMQELLAVADFLITDYSSCIWDFSLMYKPCILFAKDIETYKKERNFYVPIEKWHFPIVKTNDELMTYIDDFNEEENIKNIKKHFQEFGSFETGKATKIVGDEIKNMLFKKSI